MRYQQTAQDLLGASNSISNGALAQQAKLRIVVEKAGSLSGIQTGHIFELGNDTTIIGSDARSDIRLNDPGVSQRHLILNHTFGIPILEAFAMRTPVVASNAAAMVEIADGAAEHYNAGDHIELSKTLTKLITSKPKRTYLVEKGTERLKGFSRERFVKDYERLILKSVKN